MTASGSSWVSLSVVELSPLSLLEESVAGVAGGAVGPGVGEGGATGPGSCSVGEGA